jgi:sorting and assembly machinery component 37
MVLSVSLPNPLLARLLDTSYSNLVQHHDRLLAHLFGSWSSIVRLPDPVTIPTTLWESLKSLWPRANAETEDKKPLTDKEKRFQYGRWIWYGFAVGSMVTYLLASGLVKIEFTEEKVNDDEEEDEEEDDVVDVLVVEEDSSGSSPVEVVVVEQVEDGES